MSHINAATPTIGTIGLEIDAVALTTAFLETSLAIAPARRAVCVGSALPRNEWVSLPASPIDTVN
jgi:hypothetical protein